MININEILVDPIGAAMPYVSVDIRSVDYNGNILPNGKAVPISDGNGQISFQLTKGTYRVFFRQEAGDILYPVGYILESTFDNPPDPVTLAGILTKELPEDV